MYRRMTTRMHEECGLLTKPKLLQDMENTIKDVTRSSFKLKELQQQHDKQKDQLRAIRRHIELAPTKLVTIKEKKKDDEHLKMPKQKIHKGRPTLLCPVIPKELVLASGEASEQKY